MLVQKVVNFHVRGKLKFGLFNTYHLAVKKKRYLVAGSVGEMISDVWVLYVELKLFNLSSILDYQFVNQFLYEVIYHQSRQVRTLKTYDSVSSLQLVVFGRCIPEWRLIKEFYEPFRSSRSKRLSNHPSVIPTKYRGVMKITIETLYKCVNRGIWHSALLFFSNTQ